MSPLLSSSTPSPLDATGIPSLNHVSDASSLDEHTTLILLPSAFTSGKANGKTFDAPLGAILVSWDAAIVANFNSSLILFLSSSVKLSSPGTLTAEVRVCKYVKCDSAQTAQSHLVNLRALQGTCTYECVSFSYGRPTCEKPSQICWYRWRHPSAIEVISSWAGAFERLHA